MKKKNKAGGWLLLVIVGVLLTMVGFGLVVWTNGWNGKTDFKLAVISSGNLAMVSVSPMRDMVNIVEVGGSVPIWIPGGLGWYKSDKIMRLLKQETNLTDYKPIFFYNFGFVADKTVFLDNFEDWSSNKNLISELGIFGWIKYVFWQNSVVVSSEQINGDPEQNISVLSEIMMRDFGDDRILVDDMRLSVYNTSKETGFANFMSERLEWAGFSVMEVDNSEEVIEKCLMVYSPVLEKSYGLLILKDLFACSFKIDGNLNENEIYLYFGDGFGQMIKYSNYVRSF